MEVERRLPAEPGAARVEPALVAEDPAGHVPDPGRRHLARERVELGERERGIAVALEHEVALPGRSALLALAEHVGLDSERGAERGQRRVRRGELLVRRRPERQPRVVGEERAAGLQVEDDRARPAGADVPRVQALAQGAPGTRCETPPARPGRAKNATIATAVAARRRGTVFLFFKRDAKRQVGWVDRLRKMGRAAHSGCSSRGRIIGGHAAAGRDRGAAQDARERRRRAEPRRDRVDADATATPRRSRSRPSARGSSGGSARSRETRAGDGERSASSPGSPNALEAADGELEQPPLAARRPAGAGAGASRSAEPPRRSRCERRRRPPGCGCRSGASSGCSRCGS